MMHMANEWNIMKPPIHQFQNQQLSPYHRFCSSRCRPSVQWSVAAPSSPAPVYGYGSKPGAPGCWRLLKNHWIQLVKMFIDVHPPKVHHINQYHIYISYILTVPSCEQNSCQRLRRLDHFLTAAMISSPVLGLATAQCSIAMVTITKTTFFNGNEPIKSEHYSITHGYKMIHILIESCWFIYIDNISEATFTSQNLTGW